MSEDTKLCSNCGKARAFRVSLTKGGTPLEQARSDRDWIKLLGEAKRSQPFAAGMLTALAGLDRTGVLKFYFCPNCHHFQR
jgi:hypothetical protein